MSLDKIARRILLIGAIFLTVLSCVKGIWISLDIDESYAVAMGYRLIRGDRLVIDMWEPHQFSAFMVAFFSAPYVWIRGNTDYLIIYLRTIGVLVHAGLGLIMYRQLSRTCDKAIAFSILFIHLNFLPKWIQIPEFELMHYWFLLGIFLSLYAYFTGKRHKTLLLIGGACVAGSVLCYPTLIILYPFYIIGIVVLEKQYLTSEAGKILLDGLLFTLGAFLVGMIFLGNLFFNMSWKDMRHYLAYIFMDTSHTTYTMAQKWSMYLLQLQDQGLTYLQCLLLAAVIAVILYLVYKVGFRTDKGSVVNVVGPIVLIILLLTALLMQITSICGYLFDDKNQFFFQIKYIALIVPAAVLGIRYYKQMAIWLYLCVLPGILSVVAALFVTNMDTNAAYTKAFLGVLGSFLMFYQYVKNVMKESFWKKIFYIVQSTAGGMLFIGLLVCRLLMIRVTGCLPVTILAPLERMETGPEAGIYVLEDTAKIWNDNYRELARYVKEDDRLLYIGSENLIYVATNAVVAAPSTLDTAVFNEMYLYYYEEHPERIPDVVVYDKSYAEHPAYALSFSASLQSRVLFDWIEENFSDWQVTETDHMIILSKP